MSEPDFVVTPWTVKGRVDYDRLIAQFGVEPLTDELLRRIQKHTGELHYFLRRKIFFAHRDLGLLLDEYEKGNRFYLYTGRGPSGPVHLGHLVPWIFTKWLQEKFDAKLYFQITDDERFVFRDDLTLEDVKRFAYDNILDLIALGFDPKKTFIFLNTEYAGTLYREALKVARNITVSTTKAVFGFEDSDNVGKVFFTSMQSVPAFIGSILEGRVIPCLIPLAVDQDPHFRVARDVMPKLGYPKPAIIHSRFLPGLGPGGKMSASEPETTIYTTDKPEAVEDKIKNAFTGGRATAAEQRKHGANPDICSVCQYFNFLFEPDDARCNDILDGERTGRTLCSETKEKLVEPVVKFLSGHQKKREKAKDKIDEFMLRS
jgi:tryptophanyl-tRNA synthetase